MSTAQRPRRDEAVEPGRLGRALLRKWDRIAPRRYAVEGRHEPVYFVDLDADPPCTCRDREFRGMRCVHELRALVCELDPIVMPHVLALAERQVEREAADAAAKPRAAQRAKRAPAAQRALTETPRPSAGEETNG